MLIFRGGLTDFQPEPGPNDAPGPHYESYGSSWGNMGPLPTFPKTPSTRSRRTAPSEESDYATVTQENLAKVCTIFSQI